MEKMSSLDGHKEDVTDMSILPDNTVITTSNDNSVKLWHGFSDVQFDHPNPVAAVALCQSNVATSISYDPNNRNSVVVIWKPNWTTEDTPVKTCSKTCKSHVSSCLFFYTFPKMYLSNVFSPYSTVANIALSTIYFSS